MSYYDSTMTPRRLREAVEATPRDYVFGPEDVDVEIPPGVSVTLAALQAAALWATEGRIVRFLIDDRMLIADQALRRMAWDVGGEPATEEYLSVCPLDR